MKKGIIITIVFVIVIAMFLAGGQIFTVRHVNVVFENKTGITDESDIISVVGLDKRNNIFSVNERELKTKVSDKYADHSIVVTDVVRSFPDTVTIYVKERTPILLIKVYSPTGDERYVPTDKDFQRGTVYNKGDSALGLKLIKVTGIEVKDSFNTPELSLLRAVLNIFVSFGFEESALPYFLEEVSYDEGEYLSLTVAGTGAKFLIGENADKTLIKAAYEEYVATPDDEKVNKVFEIGINSEEA